MTVEVETTKAGCHVDITPAGLERLVHQASDENPYLIVTRDDRKGFAQAHVVPPKRDGRRRFLVEYRNDEDSPMRSTELVLERAVNVLLGWGFDRDGWTAGIRWHTEKLESVLDLRGQCEFADGGQGSRTCRLRGTQVERAPESPELSPMWGIVGDGESDDAAWAELFTRLAEHMNGASLEPRIAWAQWLSQWVVKVPREEARQRRSFLNEEQQQRVAASSRRTWPES